MSNTSKSILVTGANGQLGKTIEELHSKIMNYGFVFFTKSELDITNLERIKSVFDARRFDYCINCAAYTNVEQAEKTPEIAFKVNAEGVKNLAEVCKQHNTVLIHISTDYVFDGNKEEPYTTGDMPNPVNEYGKSKLLGEIHIQNILKRYFIIRTSWLYSKKYGNNFYKTILAKAQTESELYVTDEQTGCPTNTIDLARHILDLIKFKNKNFGLYHFCGNKAMTWYDFAKLILTEAGIINQIALLPTNNNNLVKRPSNSVLSTRAFF